MVNLKLKTYVNPNRNSQTIKLKNKTKNNGKIGLNKKFPLNYREKKIHLNTFIYVLTTQNDKHIFCGKTVSRESFQ